MSLTAYHCSQPSLLSHCCGTTLQAGWGPMWTLSSCLGVSCGTAATIRDLGCLWVSAWVSTKNGHCYPTQAPPWDQVESFPWSWQPQIQCCTVVWSEQGWSTCLAQTEAHSESVTGKLTADRADLSAPCLRLVCAPLVSTVQVSPAFLSDPAVLQPPKGACLLLVGPQDWNAQSMAQPAHSPWWVSTHVISLLLSVPSQGHMSQPNHCSSPPIQEHMYLSYSLGCIGVVLPVSN